MSRSNWNFPFVLTALPPLLLASLAGCGAPQAPAGAGKAAALVPSGGQVEVKEADHVEVSAPYTDFPDYPTMGVWPDAYYITFNMFAGGTTFSGAKACAYDRTKI
ncbi:MAG: hypothetical protein NVSMB23_15270 [Myxococcales bacterium]